MNNPNKTAEDLRKEIFLYTIKIDIEPNNPENYKIRADYQVELYQLDSTIKKPNKALLDSAMNDYNIALEINSDYAEAYFGKAKIYGLLKEEELKDAELEKVANLKPQISEETLEKISKRSYKIIQEKIQEQQNNPKQ